ncbi:MAG: hypothetical protein EPO06_07835 [Burkholderiaceae bacterium]|nr:MAG: hypothetical protein EPO06_07835 [Burkholderiaceae bacterium]
MLRAHQLFSSNAHSSADIRRLQELAQQSNGHPLHEYVESWALRTRLSNAPNVGDDERSALFDEIALWLQQHPGSLAAELLRRDWLLKLGEAEAWPLFDAQLAQWTLNDEPDVRCYALLSRYQKEAAGQAAAPELMPVALLAREPLLSQHPLGPGCIALTRALVSAGLVPRDVLWQRLRLLSEGNYGTAMRHVAEHLSEPVQPALDQIIKSAAHWLAHHPATVRDATDQELLVLALVRMAPGAPEVAAAQADSALFKQLTPAQQAYVWSRIALSAARELKPAALAWFDRAQALAAQSAQNTMPPLQFADEVYEWHARTALRAQDWDAVRRSIERMPASLQSEHAWIYWLGRAYQAQGMADKARAQYMRLALQYTFYAKLAQEELGLNIVTPPRAAAPTAEEIQAAEDSPHFRRALAFYQLDLIMEAKREWNWGCRGLNDRQLLAAADLASRHEILDRSINAAERTRLEHDFALRFPSPHRALMQEQASRLNLDSATIYGLIRQESRFAQIAQSSAGAHGLMQLMPHTAHWVAQKLGLKDYRKRDLSEVETNIVLGTNYFRMVLDDLDQSVVLASAAYNAGPRRSRDWRASLKAPVEGAIFAETIPFSETRDYVKQVLSNAVDYAALWEGKPQSIKARLGTIAPKDAGGTDLP